MLDEVLHEGLMVAGDVESAGHRPWTCTDDEAFERIRFPWVELGDACLMPGQLAGLANTELGKA